LTYCGACFEDGVLVMQSNEKNFYSNGMDVLVVGVGVVVVVVVV
jgi:hypothetical protein